MEGYLSRIPYILWYKRMDSQEWIPLYGFMKSLSHKIYEPYLQSGKNHTIKTKLNHYTLKFMEGYLS